MESLDRRHLRAHLIFGNKILSDINAQKVGKEAFSITKESQNPEDIDPGVYEVILGPDAVSTILVFLSVYGFNSKSKELYKGYWV